MLLVCYNDDDYDNQILIMNININFICIIQLFVKNTELLKSWNVQRVSYNLLFYFLFFDPHSLNWVYFQV